MKQRKYRTYDTEYWRLEPDWLACITSDKALIRRIRRYYEKSGKFSIMAEYYDRGRLVAVQWRVPARHRRVVYRLFGGA